MDPLSLHLWGLTHQAEILTERIDGLAEDIESNVDELIEVANQLETIVGDIRHTAVYAGANRGPSALSYWVTNKPTDTVPSKGYLTDLSTSTP